MAGAACGALAATAAPARAGDGESALSASLGWATYATPDKKAQTVTPTIGGAVGIAYERGFSEALSWRVAAAGGAFDGGGAKGGVSGAASASAGLVYRFDVLKYVPWVEVAGGAVWLGGANLPGGVKPVLELGGGFDVLSSRDWSWGVEAELGSFAGDTTILTVGLRSTWRWGYF